HDGSAFSAEDVAFTFERALSPEIANPRLTNYGPIEKVSQEGDVVTIKMSQPYGPFLSMLGSFNIPMLCRSSVSADGTFSPIGTGPFEFIEWVRNAHISLKTNENYQGYSPLVENKGRPHVDNVKLVVIPEAVARMAALRSGEVDLAEPS